jgi:stage IV sporulation protein FB
MVDRLAAVNLFLAVFNMIPAFPMDGGRVLRALLASRMGYVRATEIAAFIGQGVAFALGFIGLLSNPMLIFIAIFVYLAASSEAHMVAIRAMARRRCLDEAFRLLQERSAPAVAVVDDSGRLVGLVTSETIGEMLMLQKALPKGVRLGPWARPTGA